MTELEKLKKEIQKRIKENGWIERKFKWADESDRRATKEIAKLKKENEKLRDLIARYDQFLTSNGLEEEFSKENENE